MARHKTEIVTVERFYTECASELGLRLVAGAGGLKRVIREPTINRPGLVLTGFTRYFAFKRIQVIGNAEAYYLRSLDPQERQRRYLLLFSKPIPCVVFSRNLRPGPDLVRLAEEQDVPLFQCPLITMQFINRATLALETMFAPRCTELGSMVDILGVGVLIRGESGIGKSESVLALIERGYSLVSDDATRFTLVDGRHVVGTSPGHTRGYMEVRGIGILNVAAMFGVRSVRLSKELDLVITLKPWEEVPDVDRLGMEQEYFEILGQKIPHITIPVRPGRDLARLIEVAAFHIKLVQAGHNPAKELNDQLVAQMTRARQIRG
ncbi:MAG: HPr(Ser) kinase/phosphatase [Verrucomicrobiota bacterium]|nr:HPr(Ser) kinase/phosphatase [Limisphaera sp.]MDW8381344.1 HPr(Ser) kinase/phosphatase [Verrucomicrobiota bacterium]